MAISEADERVRILSVAGCARGWEHDRVTEKARDQLFTLFQEIQPASQTAIGISGTNWVKWRPMEHNGVFRNVGTSIRYPDTE
jgi:hypothetical protein